MVNTKIAEIYSMAFGGEGVAKIDGKVCFVSGALVGEKILVEITEDKKNFSRGVLREIITSSPDRIESACPYFFNYQSRTLYCPGCVYQHLSYAKEVEFKDGQFLELLKRFARIPEEVKLSPIYPEKNLNYRNKIVVHRGPGKNNSFGFVSNDNRTVLGVSECHLACEQINKTLKELSSNIPGFLKNEEKILIRYTQKEGSLALPCESDLFSQKYLTEDTEFGQFFVPPTSFFQTNTYAHNLLLSEFRRILSGINEGVVFDLYCGVGVFGILAAELGFETYFADIDVSAVSTIKKNAELRNLKKIEVFSGDASVSVKKLFESVMPDKVCLVLDPPRNGLSTSLIKLLCNSKPGSIIYVSCAADTLCRDLNILMSSGYTVKSTRIIDMFPRTKHFESITYMVLK